MSSDYAYTAPDVPETGQPSPWGTVAEVTTILKDVLYRVDTWSHGGFFVPPAPAVDVPDTRMSFTAHTGGKFFEEDCDWAVAWLALIPVLSAADSLHPWYRQRLRSLTDSAVELVRRYELLSSVESSSAS